MVLPDRFEPGDGLFVQVDRGRMLAPQIQNICLRPQSPCQGFLIVYGAGDCECGVSQTESPLYVYPDLLAHLIGEVGHDFRLKQGRAARKKLAPAGLVGPIRELPK